MRDYLFDKQYYDRFYGRRRPRLVDKKETALLGTFVCSYLSYLGQPVRSVLDIGCGIGLWRDVIADRFPRARYYGVEISRYLCDNYDWQFGSVVDFNPHRKFDLVICKDVLQYLPSRDAAAAIDNLARLSHEVLYFNTLTKEDWEENCDQAQTNGEVYLRSGNWYRNILRRHFLNLGGGLFLNRRSSIIVWELEKLD